MLNLDFLTHTHAALRDAAIAAPSGSIQREHLGKLREEAWERLKIAQRTTPLVFAMHGTYVWLGNKGVEQACEHPGHPGIGEAWTILLHGVTAGSVLNASTFGSTGNALHGRLKTAEAWIKDATGCFDLAGFIHGIKVGRDGSITPPSINREIEFQL